jgi:hypothetical protein
MNSPTPADTPTEAAVDDGFAVQLARKRHDPILEELWAVKAQINAEANYDVRRLVELARIAAAPYIGADGRVMLRP